VSLGDGASRARASPVGRVVFALPRLTLAAVVALVGCGGREASSAPLADAGDAQAVSDVAAPEASAPFDSSAMDDSSRMGEGPESDAADEAYVELSPVLACLIPTFLRTDSGGSNSGCQAVPAAQDCFPVGGAYVTADGAVATIACTTSCPPNHYFVACDGPLGTVGMAPPPDPSLCTSVGGPTGSNEQDYCCLCAPMMK